MSTSSEDTEKLGELLGSVLNPPAIIELRSDLGGGKTTFTRGLARGFGSKDKVSSPTFTLNKIYKNSKEQQIHHFDFYRLHEPGILTDQLSESLDDKKVITVVEWADIVKNVIPDDRLAIEFNSTPNSEDERQIIIHYQETAATAIKELETMWVEGKP